MANILLLDPNDTARRAMHGILARASHRMAAVDTGKAAWDFITQTVRVDLMVVELALGEGSGLAFVERLKSDCLLKLLPVIVYTGHASREIVKRGLELHVQNFLIKPYHDDNLYAEVAKALSHPWRNRHFEEENSFCKLMGYQPAELKRMLDQLRSELELARPALRKAAELQAAPSAAVMLAPLATQAEAAGAWGVVDCLKDLDNSARGGRWADFLQILGTLEFAGRLIFHQLNPGLVPLEFLGEREQHTEIEARARAVWFHAEAEQRCPVTTRAQIEREVEGLTGCPVVDSTAAAFQMAANGHPSCLNPLMDLVAKDPGLTAQMLIAANRAKHPTDDGPAAIEDPRLAVGLLGELRLAAQAHSLLTVSERLLALPPLLSWRQYWMFQIGTARMARFASSALELPSLAEPAFVAGLLHDLGKLLLLHLHPYAFEAILDHARQSGGSMAVSERRLLGCTTQEMAAHFAGKQGLPRRYANVMRWHQAPEEATEDQELVAVVSLARELCRQNHVGASGGKSARAAVPLEETAEWAVLRQSVFPGFNLRTFELQVHTECRELKLELHGRLARYAVA